MNTTQSRISKLESRPHCKIGELVELAELGGKKLKLDIGRGTISEMDFIVESSIRLN